MSGDLTGPRSLTSSPKHIEAAWDDVLTDLQQMGCAAREQATAVLADPKVETATTAELIAGCVLSYIRHYHYDWNDVVADAVQIVTTVLEESGLAHEVWMLSGHPDSEVDFPDGEVRLAGIDDLDLRLEGPACGLCSEGLLEYFAPAPHPGLPSRHATPRAPQGPGDA